MNVSLIDRPVRLNLLMHCEEHRVCCHAYILLSPFLHKGILHISGVSASFPRGIRLVSSGYPGVFGYVPASQRVTRHWFLLYLVFRDKGYPPSPCPPYIILKGSEERIEMDSVEAGDVSF